MLTFFSFFEKLEAYPGACSSFIAVKKENYRNNLFFYIYFCSIFFGYKTWGWIRLHQKPRLGLVRFGRVND